MFARVTRAFGFVAVLVLVSGVLGVIGVAVAVHSVQEIAHRVQPMRLANARVEAALSDASRGLRGYLITGDQRLLTTYERGRSEYPAAMAELYRLATEDERPAVRRQEELATEWLRLFDRPPVELTDDQVARDRGRVLLEDLVRASGALDTQLAERQQALETQSSRLQTSLLVGLGVLALLAPAVALYAGVRLGRAAGRPLATLSSALNRLAAGEDSARAQIEPSAPCEIREVADSVNALAEGLERMRRTRAERAWVRELAREVGMQIRNSLDRDQITLQTVSDVASALSADAVSVHLLSDGELQCVRRWYDGAVEAPDADATDPATPSVDCDDPANGAGAPTWLRKLYSGGRPQFLPELPIGIARGLLEPLPDSARERTYAAAFGSGAAVCGCLVVTLGSVEQWTEPASEFVEAVAADVGRAMQHAALYADQRRLVNQLQELDRVKSDFLSTVSHELRTPLTSIAGYTELLADEDAGPVTDEQARMLQVVERNTARLKSLIEDLLTLSRMEVGAFTVSYEPVCVADLIAREESLIRPLMLEGQLELQVDPGPAGLELLGDAEALERVLTNLLSNAVKFSRRGGKVGLRVEVSGGYVQISVSDAGMGIPEAEQKNLFTRFFRASNASDAAVQGTGLGLSIVQTIVEQHGGAIRIRSRENVGTTVEVRLPMLRSGAAPPLAGIPGPRSALSGASADPAAEALASATGGEFGGPVIG